MKNVKLYITALAMLMLFWGCDKGPELTPLTQEGKNTFSCKVNGKVWIPDGRGSVFVNIPPIDGGFYYNYANNERFGIIRIIASNNAGEDIEIFLNSIKTGVHLLDSNTKITDFSPANYCFFFSAQKSMSMTSAKNVGKVTIFKADTISGIISGTFDFNAGNSKSEIVKITDGRFDINSQTL
jgi:hypothetical protein